jgi:hypothetical protein
MENKPLIIELIDTEFSPEDAGKILLSLINHKIQYHQIEVFSTEERFGEPSQHSLKRLESLKSSSEEISKYIKTSIQENKKIKIHSQINIEII